MDQLVASMSPSPSSLTGVPVQAPERLHHDLGNRRRPPAGRVTSHVDTTLLALVKLAARRHRGVTFTWSGGRSEGNRVVLAKTPTRISGLLRRGPISPPKAGFPRRDLMSAISRRDRTRHAARPAPAPAPRSSGKGMTAPQVTAAECSQYDTGCVDDRQEARA